MDKVSGEMEKYCAKQRFEISGSQIPRFCFAAATGKADASLLSFDDSVFCRRHGKRIGFEMDEKDRMKLPHSTLYVDCPKRRGGLCIRQDWKIRML